MGWNVAAVRSKEFITLIVMDVYIFSITFSMERSETKKIEEC